MSNIVSKITKIIRAKRYEKLGPKYSSVNFFLERKEKFKNMDTIGNININKNIIFWDNKLEI